MLAIRALAAVWPAMRSPAMPNEPLSLRLSICVKKNKEQTIFPENPNLAN